MDDFLKEIGGRVREARLAKGLSQEKLAEAINMSPSFVSNVEVGRQGMNIRAFVSFVKVLDVSADWLLGSRSSSDVEFTADEITKELNSCSPREREAILSLVQHLKITLRKYSLNDDK